MKTKILSLGILVLSCWSILCVTAVACPPDPPPPPCCSGGGCAACYECVDCVCQCAAVINNIVIQPYDNVNVQCVGCQWYFMVSGISEPYCNCVHWSTFPVGNPPSSQVNWCVFSTHWDTLGIKTVTASTPCSSKSRQVTVAAPTNYRETSVVDLGNGVLQFSYAWDSTSGNLNDLSGCMVGEKVDYPGIEDPYCFPSPPWSHCWDNPTIIDVPAIDGQLLDIHSTGTFITPYKAASVTATQIYRWRSCVNCDHPDGVYTTLMGPHPIYREVYECLPCISGWGYLEPIRISPE
jgi:hypothetical protein